MNFLVESIGKKIQAFIPILVFCLIFLKTFAEKYSGQDVANKIYLDFGSLVAFYVIFFTVYLFFENKNPVKNNLLVYVNWMLVCIFFSTGLYLLILSLVNNSIFQNILGLTNSINLIIPFLSAVSIVLLVIIAVLSVLSAVLFIEGFSKERIIKKEERFMKEAKKEKIKSIWFEKYVFAVGLGALLVAFQKYAGELEAPYWALVAMIFLLWSGWLTAKINRR